METDVITPLMQELAGMRNTISGMIALIKKQQEQNDALKNRIEALEAGEPLSNGAAAAVKRLLTSSKNNRDLNESPERIALAAHLIHVKNYPSTWITKCGLLTQSKTQGLIKWDPQHLMDFCEVSGVMDIYLNGMTDEAMMTAFPAELYDGVKHIMTQRTKKDT